MKLSLDRLQANKPAWIDAQLVDSLRTAAAHVDSSDRMVEVIVVDDEYIRRINHEYRGLDRPTDVISFSYLNDNESSGPDGAHRSADVSVGEVYISYETLEREAREQGVDLRHLFLRIGVHGLLHVLGYDHATDGDAAAMEQEERRILLGLLVAQQVDELF